MAKKIIGISIIILIVLSGGYIAYNDTETRFQIAKLVGLKDSPTEKNDNFKIEEFMVGLHGPTSLALIDDKMILLQKSDGKVKLVKDGEMQSEDLLDFNVYSKSESGLLGIEIVDSFVFIYLTESLDRDDNPPIADNVYRYEWENEKLINPKLINSFESKADWHHGGAMTQDLEGNVLLIRGDQRSETLGDTYGILQNNPNEKKLDDTGVILRVGYDENILTPSKSDDAISHYYAIGIRNSFGLTTDPITGNIWDTENGPENYDEINLVSPKFNSGWKTILGFANSSNIEKLTLNDNFVYSDPEFVWEQAVAPTALIFAPEDITSKYKNSLFVGDCKGNLYNFKLNDTRTGFVFNSPDLKDSILNINDNSDEIIIKNNFGCISDLQFDLKNNLYVISHANNGVIYKIIFN